MLVALGAVAVVLVAVIVALLFGGLLPKGPSNDSERDYSVLVDGLKKDPKNPSLLMTIAEKEFDLGRTGDALAHAKSAVRFGKDEAGFNLRYAQLLIRDGQTAAAEKAALAEMKVSGKESPESYFLLAQIQSEAKRHDEAVKNMKKGLQLAPQAADMRIVFAQILEKSGDKKSAIAEYTAALRYMPGDADATAGLKRLGAKVPTGTASPHGQ